MFNSNIEAIVNRVNWWNLACGEWSYRWGF